MRKRSLSTGVAIGFAECRPQFGHGVISAQIFMHSFRNECIVTSAFSETYSVLGYCAAKKHFYDKAVLLQLDSVIVIRKHKATATNLLRMSIAAE